MPKKSRSILNLNLIKYDERDVYLNQEYKHQLRMRCKSIHLPTLFVEGKLLGVSSVSFFKFKLLILEAPANSNLISYHNLIEGNQRVGALE